jgi:dipeptidyl aminopeptidase/acylaminoacyl peptidase
MESYGNAMLYAKVGDPKQDRAWLMDVSPELHANQIKTPLLIAHGQNDPDVSPFQSDRMVAALRTRGIAPIYLQIPNEGHIFENEENRIIYYENVARFLAEHLR